MAQTTTTKAKAKAAKPAVSVKTVAPALSADSVPSAMHSAANTYAAGGGASPTFRGHTAKLRPLDLNNREANRTARTHSTLTDLRRAYGAAPFFRLDLDAKVLAWLITAGDAECVKGDFRDASGNSTAKAGARYIFGRDAIFRLTAKGQGKAA